MAEVVVAAGKVLSITIGTKPIFQRGRRRKDSRLFECTRPPLFTAPVRY